MPRNDMEEEAARMPTPTPQVSGRCPEGSPIEETQDIQFLPRRSLLSCTIPLYTHLHLMG